MHDMVNINRGVKKKREKATFADQRSEVYIGKQITAADAVVLRHESFCFQCAWRSWIQVVDYRRDCLDMVRDHYWGPCW